MSGYRALLGGLSLLLILTGCWDMDSLQDARLTYGTSLDLGPDGKLIQTIEIINEPQSEQARATNEIHSGTGRSVRDTSDAIRAKVTGNIRYFKYGFYLLSTSVVKNDIYPYMDVLYRDPRNPTSKVMIAVVDGSTKDVLNLKRVGPVLIGDFITKKIHSLEQMSIFPETSLEVMLGPLLDPGQDIVLPYLKLENKDLVAKGNALFHDQRMTGSLNVDQSVLYVLLSGKGKTAARFVRKVNPGSPEDPGNYITVGANVRKKKRKLKLTVHPNGDVDVDLKLKLPVRIIEYPRDGLKNEEEIQRLNRTLSEIMTRDANKVIAKLQKSSCDAFGIGRLLMAYYPKVWREKNWKEDYKKVRFHCTVQVDITGTGVFN